MRHLLPLVAAIALAAPQPAGAQQTPSMPGGMDHRHHGPHTPPADEQTGHDAHGHQDHAHDVGPAGATYDLRFLDAMVQHHTGALRMSEFVFDVGAPGVGALARTIWREQAQEIRAMGLWRKAWYPEAPVYPVVLREGGDPGSMGDLVRMGSAERLAMQMMTTTPTRANRVVWFLEGMLQHHGAALAMAHDALEKSSNPTVRRLARQIIVTQRQEIIQLRRMLWKEGLDKPAYHAFDSMFSF